jgi:hypothetical protein
MLYETGETALEGWYYRWPKKNSYSQNFSIVNQNLQRQTLLSVSKVNAKKMGLSENQKQTVAQSLKDGNSIRAIAAEVSVHKRIVLLAK